MLPPLSENKHLHKSAMVSRHRDLFSVALPELLRSVSSRFGVSARIHSHWTLFVGVMQNKLQCPYWW